MSKRTFIETEYGVLINYDHVVSIEDGGKAAGQQTVVLTLTTGKRVRIKGLSIINFRKDYIDFAIS